MKKILILFVLAVFSNINIFAQNEPLDVVNQLPSCTINAFTILCDKYGSQQINGCSVTCPANYLPVCKAGKLSSPCYYFEPNKSTCECKKIE